MIRFLILLPLLAAAGCSLAPHAGPVTSAIDTAIDTATTDRRAYNDRKADVLVTAPCDISLGAYYRLENPSHQKGLRLLCSGRDDGAAVAAP